MNFIFYKPNTYFIIFYCVFLSCSSLQLGNKEKGEPTFKSPNKVIFYYKNTNLIKAEGEVKTGCPDNRCSKEDISKLTSSQIRSFPKNGFWKEYVKKQDSNGKWKTFLKREGSYKKNKRDGFWKEYIQKLDLKKNWKNSLYKAGNYVEGKKGGDWDTFRENGKVLRRTLYQVGKKAGKEEKFSEQNIVIELKNYQDGKLEGEYWKKNKSNHFLKKGSYKEGLKYGDWSYFYDNGTLKKEVIYVDGKLNGEETNYHKNGKVSSIGENKNGGRVGTWKVHYPNGRLQAEGKYSFSKEKGKNIKTGKWTEFYSSGKLLAEGKREHIRVGEWVFYYQNGKKHFQGIMSNEFMMSEMTIYNPVGVILASGKLVQSLIKIDSKGKSLNIKHKFDVPVIYYNKYGKKEFEVTKNYIGIEYINDEKAAEGEVIPFSNKKTGCWKFYRKDKKVTKKYYINNKVNQKMGKMQGCI